MRERLVVTGGAGFIGVNFVRFVLGHTDAQIVIIDKLTYAGNLCSLTDLLVHPRVTFVEADISDAQEVHRVFTEHQPTGVVNFAAETHVDRSIDDPKPFIDTNIVGVSVLLSEARSYFQRVDASLQNQFRFLHISTDEVYGTLGPTGLFHEATAYAPNSPYAATKAGADHLVRAYHETYGLPTLITNCSNNYGPYQFPEKLIPLMLLNALDGKPLPIYGDGGNIRDWLYVEDHCDAVLLVLRNGRVGEKYNIGGHNEKTNLQVIEALCQCLEQIVPADSNEALRRNNISRYEELRTHVPDRPGHDRRYAIDASKIHRELGWRPYHSFIEGLQKTVRWYSANRDWCATVLANKYDRERLGMISAVGQ